MAIKLGYLGPAGTFSEMAAEQAVERLALQDAEIIAFSSIPKTIKAIAAAEVDYVVVPRENLIEGEVNPTLDALASLPPDVQIIQEIFVPVEHILAVASEEHKGKQIFKIYSHPQVHAQCQSFIESLGPAVQKLNANSTAEAAATVKALNEAGTAAICSQAAAETNGLCILKKNVADYAGNKTLFLVLSRVPVHYKTSIVFAVENRAGALDSILEVFSLLGLNLIKLHHRPRKENGEQILFGKYVFFAEVEGHQLDRRVSFALHDVALRTEFTKILGSYPIQEES